MTIYRQGDVLLRRRSRLPKGATPVTRKGRIVLALGEVTGHAHVIDAPPSEVTELSVEQNRRFLKIVSAVDVTHEEHATLTVAPGIYEIVIQREFDDSMEPRAVLD